jgi:hypothetical protein
MCIMEAIEILCIPSTIIGMDSTFHVLAFSLLKI